MDLEQVAEWMSQVKPLQVAAGLCTAARSSRSNCRACVDACPVGAATLGRGPAIAGTCTACGLCAAACPTGAIRMEAPSDSELLKAARKVPGDALICACPAEVKGLNRRPVLEVSCIGALPMELLAGLLASGHSRVILWRSGRCDECPQGPGSDRLAQEAVAAVNQLRPGCVKLGIPDRLEAQGQAAPKPLVMDDDLAARDRRAFLGSLMRGAGGR